MFKACKRVWEYVIVLPMPIPGFYVAAMEIWDCPESKVCLEGIDCGYILKCLCLFFSFVMTENYFVFLEQPLYVNVMKVLVNKLRGQPMIKDLFEYDSEEKVNYIEKSSCSCINISCNMNDPLHRTCSWSHRVICAWHLAVIITIIALMKKKVICYQL